MRIILILTSILFISFNLHPQKKYTKELLNLEVQEKIKKQVLILKKEKANYNHYIIQVENQATKDYMKCKWESFLSKEKMRSFITILSQINTSKETKYKDHDFMVKKDQKKIHIVFEETKCTFNHKTHYFQKSCNRNLSFKLTQEQIRVLIKTIKNDIDFI